jgi:hypothetical protein
MMIFNSVWYYEVRKGCDPGCGAAESAYDTYGLRGYSELVSKGMS